MARKKVVIEDNFANIFVDMRRIGMTAVEVVRQELGTAVKEIIAETPVSSGMAASGWGKAAVKLDVRHSVTPQPVKVLRSKAGWYNREGRIIDTDVVKGNPELIGGGFMVRVKTWHEYITYDRRAEGRRLGVYYEKPSDKVIKRGKNKGKLCKKASFVAENRVFHISVIEHGAVHREVQTVVPRPSMLMFEAGKISKAQLDNFAVPLDSVMPGSYHPAGSTHMRNELYRLGYVPYQTKFAGYKRQPLKIVKKASDRMNRRFGVTAKRAIKVVLGRPKRYKPKRKTLNA